MVLNASDDKTTQAMFFLCWSGTLMLDPYVNKIDARVLDTSGNMCYYISCLLTTNNKHLCFIILDL